MKKIFDAKRIDEAVDGSGYRDMLTGLRDSLFITEYEDGEFVISPDIQPHLIQIVMTGTVSIYFIRGDGSEYSLAVLKKDGILGDRELFFDEAQCVYAEVAEKLICLAIPVAENRGALLKNADLMRLMAESLAGKMTAITMWDAAQPTLSERVCSYMRYRCKDGRFQGVEAAAFHLHCSPRQLQRVLNSLVQNGKAEKTGKGAYRLL